MVGLAFNMAQDNLSVTPALSRLNISIIIGWVDMKLCTDITDIRIAHRMNCTDAKKIPTVFLLCHQQVKACIYP